MQCNLIETTLLWLSKSDQSFLLELSPSSSLSSSLNSSLSKWAEERGLQPDTVKLKTGCVSKYSVTDVTEASPVAELLNNWRTKIA